MKILQLHQQAQKLGFNIQADHGATLALLPFTDKARKAITNDKIGNIPPHALAQVLTLLQMGLGA
jgi:hypothetical protein